LPEQELLMVKRGTIAESKGGLTKMRRIIISLVCIGLFILSAAPESIEAQTISQDVPLSSGSQRPFTGPAEEGGETLSADGRARITWLSDDARRIQAEREASLAFAKPFSREHTYRLSDLDNRDTASAIAGKQVKKSLLDELAGLVHATMDVKKPRPSLEAIKALLPGIIKIEIHGEKLRGRDLHLKGRVRASPELTAGFISLLLKRRDLADETLSIRMLANRAMGDIEQMQAGVDRSGDTTGRAERYGRVVSQLMATDWYERALYHVYDGKPDDAMDAYTEAIQASSGLAVAYKERGLLYLHHLEDEGKANADFNRALVAYGQNARDHMASKEYDECVGAAEAALALSADFAYAYYQRAVCAVGLGRQENVTKDLVKAAQLGNKAAQDILTGKGITW